MAASLAIVERSSRGVIEEQYAHILWLARILCKMKGDIGVLLRGNAVQYALANQPSMQLIIGGITLKYLLHYEDDVRALLSDGVRVYVCREDCERLNIRTCQLIEGVTSIDGSSLGRLFEEYAHIWYW